MKSLELLGYNSFTVVIWYKESFTDEMTPEMEFAYGCENGCSFWDAESKRQLAFNNHPYHI
jgi:hypothetical protein